LKETVLESLNWSRRRAVIERQVLENTGRRWQDEKRGKEGDGDRCTTITAIKIRRRPKFSPSNISEIGGI